MNLGKMAKAIYSAVLAFVTGLGTALVAGQSLSQVDAKTWLFVIGGTLVAGGGTYGITNKS